MREWHAQLDAFLQSPSAQPSAQPSEDLQVARYETEALQFIKDVVWPAFEDIGHALRRHGRAFNGEFSAASATGTVGHHGLREFQYIIEVRLTRRGAYPHALTRAERSDGAMPSVYSFGRKRVSAVTQDDVARHFVHAYLKSFETRAG